MSLTTRLIATLICLLSAMYSVLAFSDVFTQEPFKTHLRWNLVVPKEQVTIKKNESVVELETLNLEMFEKLSGEMAKAKLANSHIEKIEYSQEGFPAKPAKIIVTLKGPSIELFSFYRDADRKYILDFWVNTDLVSEKVAAQAKLLPLPKVEKKSKNKKIKDQVVKADGNDIFGTKGKSVLDIMGVKENLENKINPDYRDYRYGASFVWNYEPLLPTLEADVNLKSKIPEAFYPIKDRELLDDPKEAHMQLSINLYRQEKWGLLNKSLSLYEKKYSKDANYDFNQFLKANALLRPNIVNQNRGITQSAINILSDIIERTKEYEIQQACFRYILQYSLNQKDYIKTLEIAKKFFVEARGQYDEEMVIYTAQVIVQALAQLQQQEKVSEFLSDKKLASILPPQIDLAYSSFALLEMNKTLDLIKRYESVEKSLVKPVHPAILYNVAESYFREAEYEKAIKIFDEFTANYSHLKNAASARLRVALMYELTNRPMDEVLVLYQNAIERSPYPDVRYEAKLRYVGIRVNRKFVVDSSDEETIVFLEQSADEKKAMTPSLKKLLWLVRLRSFISMKQYQDALTYLTSLPLDTILPAEKRVFEGDGAEIIFGLIQQNYLAEDYSRTVKIWETYKDKYEQKVALNPYMNFIVADCFIKLRLYQSFDRAYQQLKAMQDQETREYPIWVERTKTTDLGNMIEELSLIKFITALEWDQASAKLASFPVALRNSVNYSYYLGTVLYQQHKYAEASVEFEKVLIGQNHDNRLTPRQMADLLMSYVESLYNMPDKERFKTVVSALYQDISNARLAPILNISERVSYLLIETLAGEDKPNYSEIEKMAREFKTQFQKSPYISRIEYLLGLSLLRNDKVKEGKEVLSLLVSKESAPGYIREMARIELSTLVLKNKQL